MEVLETSAYIFPVLANQCFFILKKAFQSSPVCLVGMYKNKIESV